MKKNWFLLTAVIFCLFQSAFAQPLFSTIRGKVTDKQSAQALVGASVLILNTDPALGAATDLRGEFTISNVPIGRLNIRVSYIGYDDVFLSNLELNTGKTLCLTIEMEEGIVKGYEIIVSAEGNKQEAINELATVSARQLSIEDSKRYAGSLNDVSRMAQNFAGVQGANDTRNDLVIRGNSSMGVLYRLEGIDVPNPNHFALMGSSGGPISMLNNNVLANSDFFTGAFPAEYGNAFAGVFDLKMRNGNNANGEYLGQIGFNGVEGMAEGPFKKGKQASYLINYRYSTLKALKFLGIHFGTLAVPEYQDISFKFNFPHAKGQTALFGMGGISHIAFLNKEKDEDDIFVPGRRDLTYGTKLGVIGISHTQLLSTKSFLRLVASSQYAAFNIVNDTLDLQGNNPFNTYNNQSGQGKISLCAVFQHKFNFRHVVKTGGYFDRVLFNLNERYYSRMLQSYVQQNDYRGGAFLLQPFAHWQFKLSPKFTFNTGLHGQYFALNGSTAIEPRFGIKFQSSKTNQWTAAFGQHSQLAPTSMYFSQPENITATLPNKNLGFIKSRHFVIGYQHLFNAHTRFKSEVYYQYLYNIPVDASPGTYSVLNQGANFSFSFPDLLANHGKGNNYGIEFTLERFLHKGFYYLLTASLFESKYKASDGKTYNTAFNGNYNLTTLAGYEKKLGSGTKESARFTFTSNLRFTLNGGQRYTPFDMAVSALRRTGVPDYTQNFALKFADYWRTDARIGIKKNGKKITHELAVELQNFTAHKNLFTIQYNAETRRVENLYQLGFLPLAQYRVYF